MSVASTIIVEFNIILIVVPISIHGATCALQRRNAASIRFHIANQFRNEFGFTPVTE